MSMKLGIKVQINYSYSWTKWTYYFSV